MTNTFNQKRENFIENLVKEADPLPLYKKEFPLIFFWSPKSGCTSIIKWFFFQNGLLQKATNYNPWIHYFRMEVYQKQNGYRTELKNELLNGKKDTYKLVRNPYARAVSSFLATVYNEAIMKGVAPNINDGLSFKQFLYQVKKIGVSRDLINMHIAQQYGEGEELIVQNYLKIEDFERSIRNIESKYGLIQSNLSDIIKSPHHLSSKMTNKGLFADVIITKSSSIEALPMYDSFYDKETKDLVRELFKKDFDAYGYNQADLK
ncbi:sulfotransferase family 2 domain-containing protein [Rossellomorea yichunensis]|uniref:sulfotransferase family 2 domain-containing protein n=1 Tax=Rossellomorea yichunensis TaxID=3077331 RepID=UPI0028DF1F2B|nr:sulfotransferase family 2 domain-containing protein [Rossellomorea sp. YC4-1]MDT9027452.1 sulfotransferase family 2 domain-containing protein [Rossellomorea sp. YC4-1]